MQAAMAAGAGAMLGSMPRVLRADESTPATGGTLRFAHLTDVHITEVDRGNEGFATALQSLHQHNPAFIINGGDHVMDASGQKKDRALRWFDLYNKTLEANTKLETFSCFGNHDVFGWTTKEPTPVDQDFGKGMALDQLKLKKPYYSFDRGGWHFIILDNIMRREPAYYGNLDPEQDEWLKADLESSKLPKVVVTHIPLVSVTTMLWKVPADNPNIYQVPDNSMHHDVLPLVKRMAKHNVKLALSGHIHQVDEIDYMGIKFCCNGAVCGEWWKGAHLGFPEGYAIVDLHPDGTVNNKYVSYGWKSPAGKA